MDEFDEDEFDELGLNEDELIDKRELYDEDDPEHPDWMPF